MALHAQAPPSNPSTPLVVTDTSGWLPMKRIPGAFYLPLVGNAAKPGLYVYRLKAPDGALVRPHWHTQTMRVTVLEGSVWMVMGEPYDSSRAQRLPPGSYMVMPANTRHMEWFEGETVVHVETAGPLETIFVNPADDPREKPSQP